MNTSILIFSQFLFFIGVLMVCGKQNKGPRWQISASKANSEGRVVRIASGHDPKELSEVVGKLLLQVLYFLELGFVAAKKIIHLQKAELYSMK